MKAACAVCATALDVHPNIAGCILYCENCEAPPEPCETCGLTTCDGSCCECEYCVAKRSRS